MPAARGAATVGEPSSQHPAQAPLAPGDRREATTKAAARASRERGPAARGRRASRFSPVQRWNRHPCGRPTERRLIPKESHKPGLDRRGVIGIHRLLAAAALWKRRGRHPSPVSSGRRGHLTAPQRPADFTGDVGDGSRWGRKSVGDHPGPAAEQHPIERCQEKEAPGSPDTLSGAANNDTGRAPCDARPGGKTDVVRRGIRRRTHTRGGDAVRKERSPRWRATGRCRSCSGRSRGRRGTRSRRPRNGPG